MWPEQLVEIDWEWAINFKYLDMGVNYIVSESQHDSCGLGNGYKERRKSFLKIKEF